MKMEKELCCGNRNYLKLTNNINNDGKTFENLHIKRPQEDNKYEYANDDSNTSKQSIRELFITSSYFSLLLLLQCCWCCLLL